MAGPLSGFRILDLSAVISGPFGTMILADQGADVIKVEPTGGDFTRAAGNRMNGMSASFLNNNRNKRSIAVDLKAPGGVDLIRRLAQDCDVFVQNFRPGVVERLGLGEDAIREVRPDIVYVSLSGFGEKGPFAGKPVYDPIVQALSGLASVQGGSDEQRPLWSSDMGGQTYVGHDVSQQRAASFIDLIYETRDGHMSVAVMTNPQWKALAEVTGHPEWLDDPRFATTELRDLNINERLELIQSVLVERTTDEWMAVLEPAGVPCAPVLHRKDMIHHPQVQASGIVTENDHPVAGRLRQARNAARFSGTTPEHRFGAPQLGEHTDEILREAGFSDAEIVRMREQGTVTSAAPAASETGTG